MVPRTLVRIGGIFLRSIIAVAKSTCSVMQGESVLGNARLCRGILDGLQNMTD
jgi:hypothetical protein